MTDTQLKALQDFARQYGNNWKNELSLLWYSGKDSGALRQIRNNHLQLVMSKNFKLEL